MPEHVLMALGRPWGRRQCLASTRIALCTAVEALKRLRLLHALVTDGDSLRSVASIVDGTGRAAQLPTHKEGRGRRGRPDQPNGQTAVGRPESRARMNPTNACAAAPSPTYSLPFASYPTVPPPVALEGGVGGGGGCSDGFGCSSVSTRSAHPPRRGPKRSGTNR